MRGSEFEKRRYQISSAWPHASGNEFERAGLVTVSFFQLQLCSHYFLVPHYHSPLRYFRL